MAEKGDQQCVCKKVSAREFLNRPIGTVIKEDLALRQGEHEGLSIVVLGASGDLAKKKIYPTLYSLFKKEYFPKNTNIVGYARSQLSAGQLVEKLKPYFKKSDLDNPKLEQFFALLEYHQGSYDQSSDFAALDKELKEWESGVEGSCNRIFYLALPPSVFLTVVQNIHDHVIAEPSKGHTRIIVEKPFGRDTESSAELSGQLARLFSEEQIYRIDHYLGKELVQNLLVMRFANRIFMPTWNRDNVQCVRITFKEPFGTQGRGGYFDEFGIIRDILQNHLLQILCIVAMEKPVSLSAFDLRDEKVKVLRAVEPVKLEDTVVGQYIASNLPGVEDSKTGYLDDPGVPADSVTPTYCSCVLYVKNERWDGVPFIMKAGKALDERKADIRIQFKDVPGDIFVNDKAYRNEMVMRLQPDEAVYLKFNIKTPGLEFRPLQAELDMTYKSRFEEDLPDAYERLLLDVLQGSQGSFVRADELAEAWRIFTPLLKQLERERIVPEPYPYGSRGPTAGDALATKCGYTYHKGTYLWQQAKPANE